MVKRNFHACMKYAEINSNDMNFQNSEKMIYSKAQCYSILFFILLPLVNLSILSLVVIFEVKSVGIHKK